VNGTTARTALNLKIKHGACEKAPGSPTFLNASHENEASQKRRDLVDN
jgi:hypothetical protein